MRARSWLLRCYPAGWRDRYADELAAYLDDVYGADLPLRAAASLVIGGMHERARLVSMFHAAGAALSGLLIWAGIWLVVAGSNTYAAVYLNGQVWPVGRADHVDSAEVFQAGHSTVQIAAGSLVLVIAVVVGVLLVSGRTRLAAAATSSVTLGLSAWLIVDGNSTYSAVRRDGHLMPTGRGADNYRALGLHPFAAGRNVSEILLGVALLVVTAVVLSTALFFRRRVASS